MLYYLFKYLQEFGVTGSGLFNYISFRSAMAVITSLLITMIFGKRFIKYMKRRQIGESVRDLYLDGQKQKTGTPTMGGIMIIAAIIIPVLLFAELSNPYILLLLLTTVWLGAKGYMDD